jgi:hypothetical protein
MMKGCFVGLQNYSTGNHSFYALVQMPVMGFSLIV